ncbi:Receptor-like protein 12 [Ananas comosus]|uniref:Receptor-like protein 12 n=1 Tax=Ananas comosus TaxID=4615 RepID=A0A199UQU1_ANACO|nr:Receptor-like protein 12 [Ananas comosus]
MGGLLHKILHINSLIMMLCIFSTCVMTTLILSSLLWILTIDVVVASGCMEVERNALLTLKSGLVDPQNLLSSWEGEDCCKWWGVVCSNTTGHVVKLNLRNKNSYEIVFEECPCLSGEINPSLLLLSNLEHLDLSMNNFSGTSIPAFLGSFENLRYLNLSYARFSGKIPPQIGNLSKLHYLDLSFDFTFSSNTLRVDDILWLTRLSSLKYLDLSMVNLNTSTGWLHVINMLPSLKVLHLADCSLPGISTSLSHFNLTTLDVLDLGGNSINSTLPTWLRNLTSATYLDLSSNEFHGIIYDEFLHSSTLNVLFLGGNYFKGINPRALRHLCNLTTLDLSSIGFGGEIMEWVEMLPRCVRNNLQTLYLSDNNFIGNLSGWLEQMNSLTYIYLGSNLLSGSVPAGVWKLPNLISLDLYNNSLEGVVSDVELSYLRKIQYLDLSFNALIVRVRDDWVPPFQLKEIFLASCQLGPNFPTWLKSQSQLEELDLSKNIIADTPPSWFWNMSNFIYYLDLSENQIKGRLPLLLGSTMLRDLRLSSNQFEGPLPSLPRNLQFIDLSNNFFTGLLPNVVFMGSTVLWYLNLSSNQFEGQLPSLPHNIEMIDLSDNFFTGVVPNVVLPQLHSLFLSNNDIGGSIPSALCESTFLEVLDLSNNNLSGEIPECIGKSQEYLTIIDMSKNNLLGGISVSICSSKYVSLLKFSSNGLTGEFPSLQNCKGLVILDLGYNKFFGAIPLWIGESLTHLTILDLRSNMFSGSIPQQLAQLGYLQILDLSSNKLSGQIPRSFGNFSWRALKEGRIDRIDNMSFKGYIISLSMDVKGQELTILKILYLVESIDLSANNLSGEIPNEITYLQTLQYLNLSRNNLIGHIPEKIGEMQSLESLDLAMNKLSSNIPQSLSALTFLSHLNLSYNNLSGVIPTGNQLQTLEDPSIYIGNPYLCGPPSARNCSANEINYKDNKEPKDKFEWLWIYFSVVLGYLFGFAVFYGVLLLNNAWRSAYFSMIDIVCDKLCIVTKVERKALLTFKSGLVDPQNLLSSWEGEDCCKWRGVVCSNTTGHVVKLNLRNSCNTFIEECSCLSGEINPSLLLLTNLEHLDVSMNNFSGTSIPAFLGSLKNLRYLNLSYLNFGGTIPPQIGNLSKLHYLDLSFAFAFSGITLRVDDILWLTRLSSLKYLDLSLVNMSTSTGWLHAVNMLPSLKVLHLADCSLPGISTSLSHFNLTALDWNLTSITYLDLSFNKFHGVIFDEFLHLSTLNDLFLGNNGFKGMNPKALRYLCNLTRLDFSSIGFGGEIMEWVEKLPRCMRNNLQTLYLSDNNFRGNLSGWLEQMNSLTDINLGSNLFTGSIPAGVWKLPNLISLDLYNNLLEGVISDVELSHIRKIQYLDLSFNALTVRVHDNWVPPFQLKRIALVSCQLGPNFPAWLKSQTQLELLDLSKNIIADTLPNWFWNISYLDLSDNQINGRLPLLMGSTMLWYLKLSSNQFEGQLPSLPYNIEMIDLSNNFFTGVVPNVVLPQLDSLFLSNNDISGSIPSALCDSTFLEVLDLSNNNLSGEIPECIGKSQEYLTIIDMSKNNLVGGIPASVCSSEFVFLFKFSRNGLSGEFPLLQNCRGLVILDLGYNKFSGVIPLWIGESLTHLTILDLRSNMFSGSISQQLAQLGYLQILDLSSNNLSGQIPRSFGNFSWRALKKGKTDRIDNASSVGYIISLSLDVKGEELTFWKILYLVESIDLSNNNLSGEIPDEITDLQTLQYLNFSRNNLIGHIPEQIGKMESLETLDLAMNNLSGDIPQSLSTLTFLNHLNLSYNNLSGVIPTGNQLQTLEDPSIYIGNPYLCGPPSARNCSENELNYKDNKGPKDKFEWLWIYFSVVLGYLSGFVVFCGVLQFFVVFCCSIMLGGMLFSL